MAKMFKHETPAGIYLPHSHWHPNDSRINLYVCLKEPDCNPPGTSFLTGFMGDLYPIKLRSTARVMSDREQVEWLKRRPAGPLVGYWKMDEPNPGDACIDSSGNGNTGTAYGTNVVDGKIGRARSFNGNGDYIDIPPINIPNAITVSAWLYADNFLQNTFMIAKNPINTQWALIIEGRGLLKWRGAGVGTNVVCDMPSNGAWHHIVATQEGTTGSLYMDGVLRASGTLPAIGNGAGAINLGRFNSGDHWYLPGEWTKCAFTIAHYPRRRSPSYSDQATPDRPLRSRLRRNKSAAKRGAPGMSGSYLSTEVLATKMRTPATSSRSV